MIKFLTFTALLFTGFAAFAQRSFIEAESFNASDVEGKFGHDRIYYQFKKNNHCKLIFVAPRSLVHRGTWELRNDTLICTFDKFNTTGPGDNKDLKSSSLMYKFITYKNDLYLIREENGEAEPVIVPKINTN